MKYLATIVFILFLCMHSRVSSQSCLPEGITFSTQSQIDSFQVNYPGCTCIEGGVTIRSDIENLNGLNVLTSINGRLEILSDALINLQGLNNLSHIGHLGISDCEILENLSGLENLDSISGSMYIGIDSYYSVYNAKLENLSGLDNLKYIGGVLDIKFNKSLIDLTGVENLLEVGSRISIYGNSNLRSLTGLDNLISAGGILIGMPYWGNPKMKKLGGLTKLESITGSFLLDYDDALHNLAELESLTTIGNHLSLISYCLDSLKGFGNLHTIGGSFYICAPLSGVTELNKLTSIGGGNFWGGLHIRTSTLKSLSGLENLQTVGDNVILQTRNLSSLAGLVNLENIEGGVYIEQCDSLFTLHGLENLTSIGGALEISSNDNLRNLAGLDNIDPYTISNLKISGNSSLSTCDIESVCNYLADPTGSIYITSNAPGCYDRWEVVEACENSFQSCLPAGIIFTNQSQIDSFQINHPYCTKIEGFVQIEGNDISNLDGLFVLTSINGYLLINNNHILTDLSGLDNLTNVTGDLTIRDNHSLVSLAALDNLTAIGQDLMLFDNDELMSLSGLDNVAIVGNNLSINGNDQLSSLSGLEGLETVGNHVYIGNWSTGNNPLLTNLSGLDGLSYIGGVLTVRGNDALESLAGLENLDSIGSNLWLGKNMNLSNLSALTNLTSVGGEIAIDFNLALTSLSGLDNIAHESINDLYIYYNPLLSECEVQSICDYLANPNGITQINDNAAGCFSQEEVEEACTAGVYDIDYMSVFTIYPNPSHSEIIISGLDKTTIEEVNIYNRLGQKVIYQKGAETKINVSSLLPGMYVVEVLVEGARLREKLVIR